MVLKMNPSTHTEEFWNNTHIFLQLGLILFSNLIIFTLYFSVWHYSFQISACIHGIYFTTKLGVNCTWVHCSTSLPQLFMFLELLAYLGSQMNELLFLVWIPWAASSELIIIRQIWPSNSLYLNICDFYVWGHLKQKFYTSNPNILKL